MLGPSGFFQTLGDADSPVSSKDLEIIHDSEAGFNVLYRGSKNGRFFVYKALKPAYRGNPIYEELLKKDFNIGFSLTHSGICQYYGMVSLPEIGSCIVMEWIDGCSLEHLIAHDKISKSLAVKLISELCDALAYIHRKQIIHRDLKPENILITYNGNNVKIIDFGLSDADSYNAFKTPAGTKMYASPELLAGEHIDGRSDIWSLGMIIREVSGRYRHISAKCIRRDRNRRYASAADVKKAVLREGSRRIGMAALYAVASAVLAACIWWLVVNVDFPEKVNVVRQVEDTVSPDVQQPAPGVDTSAGNDVSGVSPEYSSQPVVETASQPVQKEDKDYEAIDAAALEELFDEASDMLL